MLSSEVRLGRKVDRPLWHNDSETHSTGERVVSILETDLNQIGITPLDDTKNDSFEPQLVIEIEAQLSTLHTQSCTP